MITARDADHNSLTLDLLHPDARILFDRDIKLSPDNHAIINLALSFFDPQINILAESLYTTEDRLVGKPFHLLVILLRAAQDKDLLTRLTKVSQSAESKFREIIQYDFDKLYQNEWNRGYAIALIFCAYVKVNHEVDLSRYAFVQLANLYSPQKINVDKISVESTKLPSFLNHYLVFQKRHKTKKTNPPDLLFFKKDEYPEVVLKIKISKEEYVQDFLHRELRSMVKFISSCDCEVSSSLISAVFSIKENLYSEIEQIDLIESLLSRHNSHHRFTAIFLQKNSLPSVSFELKWEWIKRFNSYAPFNGYFHSHFINFVKREKVEWAEYVHELVNRGANSIGIIPVYLDSLPNGKKEDVAKNLIINESQSLIISKALNVLKRDPEIKQFAKNIIIRSNEPDLICSCLKVLTYDDEIQDIAIKLLSENQSPVVISSCLKSIFDSSIREEYAMKLLHNNKSPVVISTCLKLLSNNREAIELAKKLLKKSNQSKVILSCLNIIPIGENVAFEFAKDYIRKGKHSDIICRCVKIISGRQDLLEEAIQLMPPTILNIYVAGIVFQNLDNYNFKRDLALKLIVESNSFQVKQYCFDFLKKRDLTVLMQNSDIEGFILELLQRTKKQETIVKCLSLLEFYPKIKEIAKKLLLESTNSNVITKCLGIVEMDSEVRKIAKRLLQENKSSDVLIKCMGLLSSDPSIVGEIKILFNKFDEPNVKAYCLRVLTEYKELAFGVDFSMDVIDNWQTENPILVSRCLYYIRHYPKSKIVLKSILADRDKYKMLFNNVLQNDYSDYGFWLEKNREIVLNWEREDREVLGNCITNLKNEPQLSEECCREVLKDWKSEIKRINKRLKSRYYKVSDILLIKSLTHPNLKALGLSTVREMFKEEQSRSGYLTDNLRNLVYSVIQSGNLPDWTTENIHTQ